MDQPKMERLLRLMMLLVGNNHYTVTQLANRLNTSSRSIYRYLDTFKEAGFAIYREGEHVRMGKESPLFKDLSQLIHFSQEEAYMVHQLIEGIDNSSVIKQNLKQKLAAIYNSKIIAHSVVKGKHADNVRKLLEAYEQKRQVILHGYSSAHGKAISDRVVEPFAFTTNYVNVWCYEPKDGKNKLFKLARIDWVGRRLGSMTLYIRRAI
ncbi:MAG: HTH domain-containing protein [Phocaeicola sp.]